ncbi:MAG: hypothetical protein EA402_09490 [Planctomycetota bacterium]|nr:MAG: hypothetical protein EA402_09490 [Planctomycetota bacterium]
MTIPFRIDSAELLALEPGAIAVPGGNLYRQRFYGTCDRGRSLDLRLLSREALSAPAPMLESEGIEAVLARIAAGHRYPDALVLLVNPEAALGPQHMVHAQGCGLVAIDGPERLACWDEALAKGLPIYGLRDYLHLELNRPQPSAVLAALAFGNFSCRRGLDQVVITEDRFGVSWQDPEHRQLSVSAVLRQGFEAPLGAAAEGRWQDSGHEGVVRLYLCHDAGEIWTQPRFIMPQPGGSAPPSAPGLGPLA